MPILSGVSGNALVAALAIASHAADAPSSGRPASLEFLVSGSSISVTNAAADCATKTRTCTVLGLVALVSLEEVPEGSHVVASDGTLDYVSDDDPDHFDADGGHVGGADVHCFGEASSLFDLIDPQWGATSSFNAQISGDGGLDGLGIRVERTGSRPDGAVGVGSEKQHFACAAYNEGDTGFTSVTVASLRGIDGEGTVTGFVDHME